jgi:hypothetical protein
VRNKHLDTLRSVAIGNTWDEIAVNIDHWVYHFQTPSVSSVLDYESSDADEGYFDRWKWLEFNSKALEDEDIDEEASAESWSISADYGLSDAEEGEDAYDIERSYRFILEKLKKNENHRLANAIGGF